MTCLRDEVLVAYADNQLIGEKRRAVEHVLAVDEESRHTVALFKLTGYHVRLAFAGIDFTGVPAWFDALFRSNGNPAAGARKNCGRMFSRWPKFNLALAACLLMGICIGSLTSTGKPVSDRSERLVALGELPAASALATALDHVAETGADWTGPDRWRATGIASFRDRFGNECREIELYAALGGEVPAQFVVACRGGADKWTVVGAVTNQVSGAPVSNSAIEAYYAPTEEEARSPLESILSMLGAQQRTSTADRKMTAP